MKKQAEMSEIKGSGFQVNGEEWGAYIPVSEIKDMEQTKVEKIWNKMNKSERFGCSMGMFPAWILEYKLTHEETVELMGKK